MSLKTHARAWIGTPFRANSCVLGMGVSCQKLVSEIYRSCGFCDIQVPESSMSHARFSNESLVEPFVASLPMFQECQGVQAGDLIGFRIGSIVHHLGICVNAGLFPSEDTFIHAQFGRSVVEMPLNDPVWMQRLVKCWRPIEL